MRVRHGQCGTVIVLHGIFQIERIFDTGGFIAGVHSQLRKTDISGGYGNMRKRNISEGRAAGDISAVAVGLHRNICHGADLAEDRGGNTVGAVALVGIEFQHDAVINNGGVGGIGVFRMVGVYGVGIVRGDHEGLAEHLLGSQLQCCANAAQDAFQKVGGSTLYGRRAYLFTVENAQNGDAFTFLCLQEYRRVAKLKPKAKAFEPLSEEWIREKFSDRLSAGIIKENENDVLKTLILSVL